MQTHLTELHSDFNEFSAVQPLAALVDGETPVLGEALVSSRVERYTYIYQQNSQQIVSAKTRLRFPLTLRFLGSHLSIAFHLEEEFLRFYPSYKHVDHCEETYIGP